MLSKLKKTSNYKWIFVILIFLIYFFRIINLEQDLPPWGIGYYQPIDEGAYSEMALNMCTYGTINPDTPVETGAEVGSYTPYHLRMNIVGNLFSFLGLKIFGNNYYGLRLPYVLIGAINLLLFFLILKKLGNKFNIILLFLGLVLCDFMFFMASRVAETSSVRLLFIQLILYWFLCFKEKNILNYVGIGFLVTFSTFCVYITNIFLYLAVLILLIFLIAQNRKDGMKALLWFCFGSIISLLMCETYYRINWDIGAIENALQAIKSFSASNGYAISGVTENVDVILFLKKMTAFWGANSLLYNLPLVLMFFLSIPFSVYYIYKTKDILCVLFLGIIGSFWLQTMFVEDCIGRKFIIVFTCLLAYIFYLICLSEELNTFIKKIRESNRKKIIFSGYLLMVCGYCIVILIYRFYWAMDNTYADFGNNVKSFIAVLDILGCILVVLGMLKTIWEGKLYLKSGLLIVWGILIVLNIGLTVRYQYINPTFCEKESMIALKEYVDKDDAYVTGGGHQLGFALYNNMKFLVVPTTQKIAEYMESGENIMLIDYGIEEPNASAMNGYFDSIFENSDYRVEHLYTIQRNFRTYDQKRNSWLYKLTEKE